MRSTNRTVGLCSKTHNIAFTNPGAAPDRSITAAKKLCSVCPLLQSCAEDALRAGGSLDRSMQAPANDVLQAGVVCRGDSDTARRLATVAGVDVPVYREQRKRNFARGQCVNCGRRMVPWTRGEVPEGYAMHYARQHCVHCRAAYRKMIRGEAGEPRRVRKPAPSGADRRRRRSIPSQCRECYRPMVTRGKQVVGAVVHGGKGLCRSCYQRGYMVSRRAVNADPVVPEPALSVDDAPVAVRDVIDGDQEPEQWQTIPEAAQRYQRPRWTLRQLATTGRVDTMRYDGRMLLLTEDLDAVLPAGNH